MAFIDTYDLAGYLGVEVTELGWLGEFAVRVASEAVEGVLGFSVTLVEDDEWKTDGTGLESLVLPPGPITEVSAVTVDDVELDEADFELGAAGILWRTPPAVWTSGRRNIVVTYTHGWSVIGSQDGNAVPMDVREAALGYARDVFHAGSAVPAAGLASEELGAYSYTVNSASIAAATARERIADLRSKLRPYLDLTLR